MNLEEELKLTTKISHLQEHQNAVVQKLKNGEGFEYVLYFRTQEEAEQAIVNFWNERSGGEFTKNGLKSGMLKPARDAITEGDRTYPPRKVFSNEIEKYPGKQFAVLVNGNDEALSTKGEAALRKLGFVE